ncbi:PfkB family carbohydrate kinase [Tissierella sp.]|uniref:1-phosphofructokinase family hexose kinase n=1 Tax=Tissierella sp. TaxID=41274 RepID=UPI0028615785|nr:PfkB family carbohydrate kinase [Tissierella sp.]MDR7855806.1 PfkB family carbohydrate kinase [Tissierella sp.]
MILTIDLNPAIDRKYTLDRICIGKDTALKSSVYSPGGNGIVSSALLDTFNEDSFITGFLGGINGEYYHRSLVEIGIMHEFVPIKDETRANIKILDQEDNLTSFSEEGPRVSREEIVKFYELYSRLMSDANIVCGVGSVPMGVPKDIYFDFVSLANKNKKKFILNVKGDSLASGIDASPYMVILKQRELEDLMKLSLSFENEVIKAGRYLLDKGVPYIVIDLEKKGSIVLGQDKGFRIEVPYLSNAINITDNSGMSAGLALGISRNYDMEMTLRLGQAFSIAPYLNHNIMKIEMSDVKRIMSEIEIFPINY